MTTNEFIGSQATWHFIEDIAIIVLFVCSMAWGFILDRRLKRLESIILPPQSGGSGSAPTIRR